MQTFRLLVLFATANLSAGFLAGGQVQDTFAQSAITAPITIVQEEVPSMEVEPAVVTEIEPVLVEVEEPQMIETPEVEVETEEGLTHDQLTQRDVGEEEAPVPEEVRASWYVEETAAIGLQLVLETYAIQDFSFVIDSAPSNYVYQYELYADSPDGGHVNLIGIFQYDATGERTFQMDPVTGMWE